MELSVLSTEYVKVSVSAFVGGQYIDPSGDTVQMAFPLKGVDPVSGDWKAASWETVDATTHNARCLVGPAGGVIQLAKGAYEVWVKITDSPEVPAKNAGFLRIT